MDGVLTQCPERHPETDQQCVRLSYPHDEHTTQHASDVYCRRWADGERG